MDIVVDQLERPPRKGPRLVRQEQSASPTTQGCKPKRYSFQKHSLPAGKYKVPEMLDELGLSVGTWTDIQDDVRPSSSVVDTVRLRSSATISSKSNSKMASHSTMINFLLVTPHRSAERRLVRIWKDDRNGMCRGQLGWRRLKKEQRAAL